MRTLTLAARPTAAGCARVFLRRLLPGWGLAGLAETAELLASALVADAVAASGGTAGSPGGVAAGPVRLLHLRAVRAGPGRLLVALWDPGARPPVPDAPGVGGGLLLAGWLSSAWGWHQPRFGGTLVWFELGGTPPAPAPGPGVPTPVLVGARRLVLVDDLELPRQVLHRLRRLP